MGAHGGVRFSELTTFRLGGPCRRLIRCTNREALLGAVERLRAAGTDYLLIGGGSNLLVSDAGLDRAVVRYAAPVAAVRGDGDEVVVDAAAPLDGLARWCVEHGREGLLFATGIPGTVGGAVVGNAGAYGEQLSDRLVRVTLMDREGRVREEEPAALRFAYRTSALKGGGSVVLSARFRLQRAAPPVLTVERERILSWRRERHPDWRRTPCAGSFFRNVAPTSSAGRRQAAGWYLEQAGAKELRVGGARVFEKHANIIVKGDASCTARDVYELAGRMADAVAEKFGFRLKREVELVGPFEA